MLSVHDRFSEKKTELVQTKRTCKKERCFSISAAGSWIDTKR